MAALAAENFRDLFGYLNIRKEINKDNVVFRIVTSGSFSVLIISALVCGLTSYFGDPIVCDTEDTDGSTNTRELIEAHCWLHGTRIYEDKYGLPGGETCLTQPEKDGDEKHTLYYQWVVFMLILSAILLKLPAVIWSMFEGGLMSTFYNEESKGSGILKQNQVEFRQAVENEAVVFRKIEGSWTTNIYYLKFLCCQLLALAVMVANFYLTDSFLNNKFATYGTDVVSFYKTNADEREFNPMCNTFPTRVSCTFDMTGKSGAKSTINKLCILRQNIINEKIYLFLWFWFVAMFVIQAIQIFLEICFMALPHVRRFFIFQAVGNKFLSSNINAYLTTKSSVGDVFVLYQMSKNTHSTFFYELLEYLSKSPQDEESLPMLGLDEGQEKIELKNTNQVA